MMARTTVSCLLPLALYSLYFVDDVQEDDPNITIAPKKENWDLKREIKPKLDRLEKQTQTAIAELVRERVENEVKEDHR